MSLAEMPSTRYRAAFSGSISIIKYSFFATENLNFLSLSCSAGPPAGQRGHVALPRRGSRCGLPIRFPVPLVIEGGDDFHVVVQAGGNVSLFFRRTDVDRGFVFANSRLYGWE